MAGKFVNVCGPVTADTVYADDTLVARDVAITLPAVTPATADLQIMGTYSMPIWSQIEHMEAAITKIGVDKGLRALINPKMKPLEVRWVQPVTDASGATRNVGCKAFLKGTPMNLPEVGLEIGAQSEHECTIGLLRYQLYVDGEEMWLIDRTAGIVRIAGVDYADMDSML